MILLLKLYASCDHNPDGLSKYKSASTVLTVIDIKDNWQVLNMRMNEWMIIVWRNSSAITLWEQVYVS